MKRSWQRALIGELLMLNALPFALDNSNRLFFGGLICLAFGLVILAGPFPQDRDFTWLDAIRVAAAAASLCVYLMFRGRTPSTLLTVVFFLCMLLLLIPWAISGHRKREADNED